MMRTFAFLWIFTLLGFTAPTAGAAEEDPVEARLAATRAEHRMTVARALELGPAEAPGFWKVYETYTERIHRVERGLIRLIVDFKRSQDDMTDEKAAELLAALMDLERQQLEARRSYASDLAGVVSDRTRARAYQIERKFQAVADFNRAKSLPLLE